MQNAVPFLSGPTHEPPGLPSAQNLLDNKQDLKAKLKAWKL